MKDIPRTVLIGHTGFVGSNLAAQRPYDVLCNSRNIAEITGGSFDLVVCAGVNAIKWKANKDPEADWQGIQALLEPLATIRAKRFILISTIDVYARPNLVTEADAPPEDNHAYGYHRLKVEQFVARHFPVYHIVRLPGIFGAGLKKNVIYDLLHDNCLDAIQPASAFQYYHLDHLSADLEKAAAHDVRVLNLATEPVSTQAIIDACTPGKRVGANAGPVAAYDFRSQHAALWGGQGGYLYDAPTVLAEIRTFMEKQQAQAGTCRV
ncbi:MAG: hypothetical protein JWO94_1252 [Verrucomicrobiaceae bacterium]|nr:hypothetical protein [Verrucomicrobiaceae bacterium]